MPILPGSYKLSQNSKLSHPKLSHSKQIQTFDTEQSFFTLLPLEIWIEIYCVLPLLDAKHLAKCYNALYQRTRKEDVWQRRFRNDFFEVDLQGLDSAPAEFFDPTKMRVMWFNPRIRKILEENVNTCQQARVERSHMYRRLDWNSKVGCANSGLNWIIIDIYSKHAEKHTTVKSWKTFYKSAFFELVKLKRLKPKPYDGFIHTRILKTQPKDYNHIQVVDVDSWNQTFQIDQTGKNIEPVSNCTKVVLNLYMSSLCLLTLILPSSPDLTQVLENFNIKKNTNSIS